MQSLLRPLGFLSIVSLLVLALVPTSASAAQTWKVAVGAQTPDKGVQANAFFNNDITVDVGDTVVWSSSVGEIHTVTFLSGGPRPDLIISGPGGQLQVNPDVLLPAGGPSYDGAGYINSGVVPEPGLGKNPFGLTFTQTGTFSYVCLVHPEMTGTVHVAPANTPYPTTQADYDRQSQVLRAQVLGQGRTLDGQARATAAQAGPTNVTLGIGDDLGSLAVMRMTPEQRVVHVGDTVTWTNHDPETPHTVTFGTEPAGGLLAAFAPSGSTTLSAPGQSVNSGFIGAGLPFGTQFQVTFTGAGTYSYICALHDDMGMKGTIIVVR
jgi:plastocyanin